jgi:hypothetical protein
MSIQAHEKFIIARPHGLHKTTLKAATALADSEKDARLSPLAQ